MNAEIRAPHHHDDEGSSRHLPHKWGSRSKVQSYV
jgi:hypothetical protein